MLEGRTKNLANFAAEAIQLTLVLMDTKVVAQTVEMIEDAIRVMCMGSVPAKVVQLIVNDMLFQEYFRRNQMICEEDIERKAAILSRKYL